MILMMMPYDTASAFTGRLKRRGWLISRHSSAFYDFCLAYSRARHNYWRLLDIEASTIFSDATIRQELHENALMSAKFLIHARSFMNMAGTLNEII